MVRRALVPVSVAAPIAFVVGVLAADAGAGWSAVIGVAVVLVNFAAHGLSLAWASRISVSTVHAVALGGVVVRLGVIVGLLFLLDAMAWFSPLAFGLAVVPGTLALLAFEAKLTLGGVGTELQIPADVPAARAHEALAAKEARV